MSFSPKEGKGISKPIIQIAKICIALSILVMIVSVSITKGFQSNIKMKLAGYNGHIQISSFENSRKLETNAIVKNQQFYTQKTLLPNVNHIQIFATKAGVLRNNNSFEGVILKGVSDDYNWEFYNDFLLDGVIPKYSKHNLQDSILVSSIISKNLSLKINDRIAMYFIAQGQRPRARVFIVSGVFQTGLVEFDSNTIIGDINHIRRLNGWDSTMVGGFELILKNLDNFDSNFEEIYQSIGNDLNAVSMFQVNSEILNWIKLFDNNISIILAIMILVSVVNMITVLFILILGRVKLIGIIKSLGISNNSLRMVFIYKAIIILGQGLIWGNILAIIILLAQKYLKVIKLDPQFYYMSFVPVELNLWVILLINAMTIFICFITLQLPSYYLKTISPSKIMRFT